MATTPDTPIETIRKQLSPALVTRATIVIVGLGGIGLWLSSAVVTFLAGLRQALGDEEDIDILLCDGDHYGLENTYRMDIPDFGNKAEVVAQQMIERLDGIGVNIRWRSEFVTDKNVQEIITEGDCVLLACDNHATRNLVSRRCSELNDVVLISGGNDGIEDGNRGTYGNIQVYERNGGEDATASLVAFHPDIAADVTEDDKPELSCVELAVAGVPQLSFVNMAVASAMCNALLRLLMPIPDQRMYDEVALDILDAVSVPHWLSGSKET